MTRIPDRNGRGKVAERRRIEEALAAAHTLADFGVPIFCARLTRDGDPDRRDPRWREWQETEAGEASHQAIDSWEPGDGLCAVGGVVCDFLDCDPRNGGQKSLDTLNRAVRGLEHHWRVKTPSDGYHLAIPLLKVGKHSPIPGLPGLDLQGGRPDGTGRGFVFIPPTERPSKVDGKLRAYRYLTPVGLNGAERGPLATYVAGRLGTANGTGGGARRHDGLAGELREACLTAEDGGQRGALLRYVHELEKLGRTDVEIVNDYLIPLVGEMPKYPSDKGPWYPARTGRPDRWLRGLLHQPGTVIGDATDAEMGAEPFRPVTSGLVESFSDAEDEIIEWLWPGYIALGWPTQLDGEKGHGKSSVAADVSARASRGRPMPGQPEAVTGPVDVMIFTDEDNTKQKLKAAGADLARVKRPKVSFVVNKRGEKKATQELLLPDGAPLFGKMIREAGASLAIFDPITDFLDETINSHNDAQVRRALRPLGAELRKAGCAGLAIRHMNQDSSMAAKYRGSGSSAFQNRARVHLVTGELPFGSPGTYGLSIADTNLTDDKDLTLAYSIVDSDVPLDDRGRMVGRVRWHGITDVSANSLTRGEKRKPGPAPEKQPYIRQVLEAMFAEKPEWWSQEARERVARELEEEGITASSETVDKVRDVMGIVPVRQEFPDGKYRSVWTAKPKIGESK